MATNQASMSDARRAAYNAANLSNTGGRFSARGEPETKPTLLTIGAGAHAGVNGGKSITNQQAVVEWLDADSKLLLPAGLKAGSDAKADREAAGLKVLWNTFLSLVGAKAEYEGVGVFGWVKPAVSAPAEKVTIAALTEPRVDEAQEEIPVPVFVEVEEGHLMEDGTVRGAPGEDRSLFVNVYLGPDADDVLYAVSALKAGDPSPTDDAAALGVPAIKEQLCGFLSAMASINFNVVDHDFLSRDTSRWADDDCEKEHPMTRFTPRLSSYTLGIIAGLNLGRLADVPRLAWARAYGVAVGLVPADGSVHNVEYAYTHVLPEDGEMRVVYGAHPPTDQGQKYLRGCMSLLAAFGYMHLQNDHTYRGNDESLKRKAKAAVRACRTALEEGEPAELTSDRNLPVAIRTTGHCFGLSATWGVFKLGRTHQFIAEPLQIRDCVVPPQLQRLSLVVDELAKIVALPVGSKFRDNYATEMKDLGDLLDDVVSKSTTYSSLSKHYGATKHNVVSPADEAKVTSLLPIVAGYVAAFGVDAEGEPAGAALSHVIANAFRDNAALCEMYTTAFNKYKDEGEDLVSLLTGGSASTSA